MTKRTRKDRAAKGGQGATASIRQQVVKLDRPYDGLMKLCDAVNDVGVRGCRIRDAYHELFGTSRELHSVAIVRSTCAETSAAPRMNALTAEQARALRGGLRARIRSLRRHADAWLKEVSIAQAFLRFMAPEIDGMDWAAKESRSSVWMEALVQIQRLALNAKVDELSEDPLVWHGRLVEYGEGFGACRETLEQAQDYLAARLRLMPPDTPWGPAMLQREGLQAQAAGAGRETKKPGAEGAGAPAQVRRPLTPNARAVLDLLRELPPTEGLTGKEILDTLAAAHVAVHMDQSTLTRRVIPALRPYGVRNARGVGYYIESPHSPEWPKSSS